MKAPLIDIALSFMLVFIGALLGTLIAKELNAQDYCRNIQNRFEYSQCVDEYRRFKL